jgi:hypothetical protein
VRLENTAVEAGETGGRALFAAALWLFVLGGMTTELALARSLCHIYNSTDLKSNRKVHIFKSLSFITSFFILILRRSFACESKSFQISDFFIKCDIHAPAFAVNSFYSVYKYRRERENSAKRVICAV